jgi:hypothetical protein
MVRGGVLAAVWTLLALGMSGGGTALAQQQVEKKVFEAGAYQTRGGGTVANARVGYQTMGRLNEAGDNAVLIAHFFSGNSHAFGRLGGANGPVGYWDAIIGPGKPIDTDRFFVVSSDTLVNVNVGDPNTTTTGPATLDPATGRPYGMTFPVVSMRDFVEVQKKLLDSLGVKRLALVAGPSNGGLQAIEWAAAYPEMVERVMPVIAGEIDAWMQGWLDIWEAPIRLDPELARGRLLRAGREPPLRGLAEAWKIVTLQGQRPALGPAVRAPRAGRAGPGQAHRRPLRGGAGAGRRGPGARPHLGRQRLPLHGARQPARPAGVPQPGSGAVRSRAPLAGGAGADGQGLPPRRGGRDGGSAAPRRAAGGGGGGRPASAAT